MAIVLGYQWVTTNLPIGSDRFIFGVILGTISLVSCSHSSMKDNPVENPEKVSTECHDAVKAVLGPTAEIVKYVPPIGRATDAAEAVAIVRLKDLPANANGLPVSQMAIFRFDGPRWRPVLRTSKDGIVNDAGYVGVDYIDYSYHIFGYRVSLSDRRGDGKPGVDLFLSYLVPSGESEGVPTHVAWNAVVGRYQEVVNNEGPFEFTPELRQPPHRRTGK